MLIRNYTDLDVALGKKRQCFEMGVRGERGVQLPLSSAGATANTERILPRVRGNVS